MSDLSVFDTAQEEVSGYPTRLREQLTEEQWASLSEACRSGKYSAGAVRKVLMAWTDKEPHSTTVRRLMERFQSGELV